MSTGTVAARVRPATAEDAGALAMVQVASFRSAYQQLFPPGHWDALTVETQTGAWRRWLAGRPETDVLVLDGSGPGLIGFAIACRESWFGMDGVVHSLHVLPLHRGYGYGRALLCAAVTALMRLGCQPIGLSTHEDNPVRSWYDEIGGVVVDEEIGEAGGHRVREVVYRWDDAAVLSHRLEGWRQRGT